MVNFKVAFALPTVYRCHRRRSWEGCWLRPKPEQNHDDFVAQTCGFSA
jgi:hypothetical protein